MIKAELRSEYTFCFTINASIFNERVLTKALYWYAESFIIPASIMEYSIKCFVCVEVNVLMAYVRS